jgi:RNA polymerase sigma-70 factor (ECF subfamily)
MPETDPGSLDLLRQAAAGDQAALTQVFSTHRDRLKRMVRLRLNQRLKGRVDESDVVQDALMHASEHLAEYVTDPRLPLFLWLRHIVSRRLLDLHRRHLGAEKRDASLEISLDAGPCPAASSVALAAQLLGRLSSPSQNAMRAELRVRVVEALEALEPLDREILALRHYEQLSNSEVAVVLDVSKSTASTRYLRALKKVKHLLINGTDLLSMS